MKHIINYDFKEICNNIIFENKTLDEWAEIESDDMFSNENYTGGFDATEMEFCFSVFVDKKEYWFQIPLSQIIEITKGTITELDIHEANY